jgi:hypothetical protein
MDAGISGTEVPLAQNDQKTHFITYYYLLYKLYFFHLFKLINDIYHFKCFS